MQALASTMTPISEELGAKIVKEKIDIELDGKAWRGARVLAVRPDTEGAYYATCHVALREKVMLSCCASTADGISKCQPMLEFLAVFGER
jgi:hypothetical protein